MPSAILYQPNTVKSCFFIYPIRNFITAIETRNAVIVPAASTAASSAVKRKPNFIIFIALIPNIAGTARKNVNSVAATLDTPIISAPIIVAPLRDVPGIIEST